MKLKKHLISLSLSLATVILGFVVVGSLPAQQKDFDIKSVSFKGCGDGGLNCGVQTMSLDEQESIPMAKSSLVRHRGLPSKFDLSDKMPPVDSQGQQGSCTAWASTYYIRSYYEFLKTKKAYDAPVNGGKGSNIFSPAFTYNQINGGKDSGSALSVAMTLLVNKGAVTWQEWPYNQKDYLTQPTQNLLNKGLQRKAKSFDRLTTDKVDPLKSEIAKGNPILTAVYTYPSFTSQSKTVIDNTDGGQRGGHAIALVGYDDNKVSPNGHKGAFKFINSWGKWWGQEGFGWISYQHFSAVSSAFGGAFILRISDIQDNKEDFNDDQKKDEEESISAPSSVAASQGSYSDKVVVTWSSVTGALAYQLERKIGSGNFMRLAYVTNVNYSDAAVQADVTYFYRVVAVGSSSRSEADESPIAEGFAKTQETLKKPVQVTGLSHTNSGSGAMPKILLSWSEVADAKSYDIARFDSVSNKWSALGVASTSSYTDTNPVRDARNVYRVRAKNSAGAGPYSDPLSVNIAGKETIPGIVTDVTASQGEFKDKIELTWPEVAGATGYYLYRYDNKAQKWEEGITVTTNRYTDNASKIRTGKKIWYTLLAFNETGYSTGYSEYVWGSTGSRFSKRAAGGAMAPENLIAKVNEADQTVTLTWTASKGATEYNIFRHKDKVTKKPVFVKAVKDLTFSEKLPGAAGELYYYTVRAMAELGESEDSKPAIAFINPKLQIAKHRFLKGAGLEKFAGKWKATYVTKDFKAVEILVEVKANAEKFSVVYKEDKTTKTINGTYATDSSFLLTDGFKMSLSEFSKDVVSIEVREASFSKHSYRLNFTKI